MCAESYFTIQIKKYNRIIYGYYRDGDYRDLEPPKKLVLQCTVLKHH